MITLSPEQKVMVGTTLLGAVAGLVGCFAVLRRRALVGDMLAHAALPGLCLAFLAAAALEPVILEQTGVNVELKRHGNLAAEKERQRQAKEHHRKHDRWPSDYDPSIDHMAEAKKRK